MPPHEQQLEDDDGQPEGIVVCGSRDLRQRYALQLRGCVLGHADSAEEGLIAVGNLETVGINQRDGGRLRYEDTRLVDIADDAIDSVHGGYRLGDVLCGSNQKAVVGLWKVNLPGAWRIQFVQGLVPERVPHQEAREPSRLVARDRQWKGDLGSLAGHAAADHDLHFLLAFDQIRDGVDLYGVRFLTLQTEHLSFTALAQARSELKPALIDEDGGCAHRRTARTRVLSSSERLLMLSPARNEPSFPDSSMSFPEASLPSTGAMMLSK